MPDIEQIRDILLRFEEQSPSGFAIAFHIRFTTPDFLFQTYPKDWIDLYSEKGMVMFDPIVRWGFAETGHVRWSALGDLDEAGVLEQSVPFGMSYGVAIATDEGNSRSVAGFARDDREFTDAEITSLAADVETLHRATATTDGMTDALRNELHKMSVEMTHPPARK